MPENYLLRREREKKGWSQAKLAELVGTTPRTISRWERGVVTPYPYYRERLCNLFGKTGIELGFVDDLQPPSLTVPDHSSANALAETLLDPSIPFLQCRFHTLVGRESLIQGIKGLLFSEYSPWHIALYGLPGMGKTALCVALALDADVQNQFRNGVLWVGLGPQPDVPTQLARWGKLLNVSPQQSNSDDVISAWSMALRTAIGNRHMLLVIDDVWRLEDALPFLIGGPHSKHLLSTRIPRIAYTITTQEAIRKVPELDELSSQELLKNIVPNLSSQGQEAIQQLIRAVNGSPLALTLIGRYLALQAFSGQPRRIQASLTYLRDAEHRFHLSIPNTPSEQLQHISSKQSYSLYAAIAVSDQALSSAARQALRDLSILPTKPQQFSEEVALAVTQQSVEVIDELLDAGLLESSHGYYTLHQTIADYARLHSDMHQARERLVQYVVQFITQHHRESEALERNSDLLFYALDIAYKFQMVHEFLACVRYLTPLLATIDLSRAEYYLREANALIANQNGAIPTHHRAMILFERGKVARQRSQFQEAFIFLQQALSVAEQGEEDTLRSDILSTLGWVAVRLGQYAQAEIYCRQGIQLAEVLQVPELLTKNLMSLITTNVYLGNYLLAEDNARRALIIAEQYGNRGWLYRQLLNMLGHVLFERGCYQEALNHFLEAYLQGRQYNEEATTGIALGGMSRCYGKMGLLDEAEQCREQATALLIQKEHEKLAWVVGTFSCLCDGALEQEDLTKAKLLLQKGTLLVQQLRIDHSLLPFLFQCTEGEISLHSGEYERAEMIFQDVILRVPAEARILHARAYYGLARLAVHRANFSEAHEQLLCSLEKLVNTGAFLQQEIEDWAKKLPNNDGVPR